jgi:hypothetical protein
MSSLRARLTALEKPLLQEPRPEPRERILERLTARLGEIRARLAWEPTEEELQELRARLREWQMWEQMQTRRPGSK